MRTFEFTDGTSNKFWNIDLDGKQFTVTFGRIGTKGQTQTKAFADATKARAAHDKLVAEKLGKGYVETTEGADAEDEDEVVAASPEQRALEAAIAAHPDDLAARSAYADYLAEQGDPRGEFAQVQLALEDPARPAAERKDLQKREAKLLKAHARTWLGDAARFFAGKWSGPNKPFHARFARGCLDYVRVLPFPVAVLEAVARTPEARFVRHLDVVYEMELHPFDFEEALDGLNDVLNENEESYDFDDGEGHPTDVLTPVAESPHLTNLRVLRVGYSDDRDRLRHSTMVQPFENCDTDQLLEVLEHCPKLEELYLNASLPEIERLFASPLIGNLRVFQYYFGMGSYSTRRTRPAYPLAALASNPAAKNLTTLRLHPGRDATIELDQLEPLLKSKNLPNLTHLQVHMTTFGDAVCDPLIGSGILKRLKSLDLGYGDLTDAGALALAAAPGLKNLEVLNVSRNALTAVGVAALRAAGVQVVADAQHDANEHDFLYEVDAE